MSTCWTNVHWCVQHCIRLALFGSLDTSHCVATDVCVWVGVLWPLSSWGNINTAYKLCTFGAVNIPLGRTFILISIVFKFVWLILLFSYRFSGTKFSSFHSWSAIYLFFQHRQGLNSAPRACRHCTTRHGREHKGRQVAGASSVWSAS